MRDHAIVSPQFWIGETGRALRDDPDAQRLALYLLTCPNSNMIGLYYLPIPTICHELGISREGALKGLRRAFEGGFARYDEASEVVFVTKMARFQVAQKLAPNDNRIKAITKLLESMRKCVFYNDFLKEYAEDFHLKLKPLQSPSEAPSEPLRRGSLQEQDQDQDINVRKGDGDELDHQVRAFLSKHTMLTYDPKTAAKLRRLVEAAGWEKAREYIDRGIAGGNAFPVAWALTVWASDKAKNDIQGHSQDSPEAIHRRSEEAIKLMRLKHA